MKFNADRSLSLSEIRDQFDALDVNGPMDVCFAHYPMTGLEIEEFMDLFKSFSSYWESLSFHACPLLNDLFLHRSLFSIQSNLRILDLSSCKISDEGVMAVSHSLHSQSLVVLKFGSSTITDDSIIELCEHCPELSELHLTGCSKITDRAVIEGLKAKASFGWVPFHVLMLSACKRITNKSIIYLADTQGEFLKKISASFCFHLTDNALVHLSLLCKNLTMINLCGCKLLGDSTGIALIKNCPDLSSISLNSCKRLSLHFLDFLEVNPSLRFELHYVDIRGCVLIEKMGSEEIQKRVSNIRQSALGTHIHIKYK